MNSKLTRNVDMTEYTCTAHVVTTRARKEEARTQSYMVLLPTGSDHWYYDLLCVRTLTSCK